MTKGRSRITINYIKKIVIACVICVVGIVGTINVNADTKKFDIVVNKTKTIKVKKPSVKVKWTIKNKKIVKIVKIKGKKNNILKIKGIKNGKTKIIAKYKNKKRVFIINVVNKNKKKNTDSEKIIIIRTKRKIVKQHHHRILQIIRMKRQLQMEKQGKADIKIL